MTWISLICLLALTSSAFGRSAYGGSDVVPQTQILPSGWNQMMIPKAIVPTNTWVAPSYGQAVLPSVPSQRFVMHTPTVDTLSSYQQQQQQQPIQQSYGAQITLPKTLPVQSYAPATQGGYGAAPVVPQFDQPAPAPVPILTEADILCQGHQAEEIIPIDNNRKFVICLDNGKGVEQQCPKGLYYHPSSQRCERNLGPLEDACSSQPCLNGGQCLTVGSSFQCQCAPGYDGVVCELDARVCQTQQPCGSSPDIKCQSFRVGAALSYVCVFQDGLGYGLNAQQIIPSPCQDKDGPQALAFSQNGFLMCDTRRLFVESCPGGTIWDDVEKACSWPDQQLAPQEPKTLPSGYGYGSQVVPQQQPVQSYSSQMVIPQQTPTVIPKQLGLLTQSYGAQIAVPQQQPKMIIPKQFFQPTQGYGAQIPVPQPLTMTTSNQFLQPTQSYGATVQIPQEQPKMIIPKQFFQPTQGYGAQIPAPKQLLQPTQSYGAATVQIPQEQPKMITPKQFVQPTQSYGATVQIPQEQPKLIVHHDAQTPYGAAQFSSY